jgi:hypothetical protein
MFSGMREERSAACASDLRFDAFLAGELEAAPQAELVAHVAACARCRARCERLVQARERFAASPVAVMPAFLQAGRSPRPARRGRATGLALSVAACVALAAAAMLVLIPQREPEGDRVKGGEHVSYFVKRGDTVLRGARKQRVQPGDKLRFAYTVMGPRYLAIVSIDAADKVSVYYPAAERAAKVAPGVEVPLPTAVELDAVLGEERVFVLFCETAEELAPLRAQLLKTPHTLQAPRQCSLDELLLTKEAPTP